MVTDNKSNKMNYFLQGPIQDNDKKVSAEIMQQPQRNIKIVFIKIGYFDGTFLLQVKPDSKPYQAPSRPLKEEIERL